MTSPTAVRHRAIAAVLAVVVGAALVISYQGLLERARAAGVPTPFLFPVIVDAFALMVAVVAWSQRAEGRRVWPAHATLVAVTAWSVLCQVTTVKVPEGADPSGFDRLVHAWAPILAVAAFEFLLSRIDPVRVAHDAPGLEAIDVDALEADLQARFAGEVGEWGPETEFPAGPDLPPVLRAVPAAGLEPWLADTIERLHREDGVRSIDQITGRMIAEAKGLQDSSSGRKIKSQNAEAITAFIDDLNAREVVR